MAIFNDRRTGVIHDLGYTEPPTHDPAQGLAGWASVHHDARVGLAATMLPSTPAPAPNPYAFTPNITSPAERRAQASRTAHWSGGSVPVSQTVLPGHSFIAPGRAAQNVLPSRPAGRPMANAAGWVAQPMKVGASFAQKARRTARMI